MKKVLFSIFFTLFLLPSPARCERPTLVVNIVVSQMRYDYLRRFEANLADRGFRRFIHDGIVFNDARYNFMQTTTPAALATITTGADPSTHGIISERWIDYTNNRTVYLIEDYSAYGLDTEPGAGRYSPANITVPTIGDRLREEKPDSKIITIASDPVSAVVMGGQSSEVYWVDPNRGIWVSSTAYMSSLPRWVTNYNELRTASQYLGFSWNLVKTRDRYVNRVYSVFDFDSSPSRFKKIISFDFLKRRDVSTDYSRLLYTPVGNTLVAEFAKQAMVYENLGKGDRTDILNICFDTPRYIGEVYGPESMELEDMFYRLDQDIADLITFITAQVDMKKVAIVLTSDHGSSDSYDYGEKPRDTFNSSQFKVIVNGFMNAQYGPGDWVIDYVDRQLFLNRNMIYINGLSLEEVQNRVAAFALQFRGISHVLTSTAMQNSYFSGSYAEKMQNSFYPRRAGDLTINLMPGWIEEREGRRSASGSMYEYDVHVPLMILGSRFYGQQVNRTVNMRDLAPTLARIMGIGRPIAAEGEPIEEVTRLY